MPSSSIPHCAAGFCYGWRPLVFITKAQGSFCELQWKDGRIFIDLLGSWTVFDTLLSLKWVLLFVFGNKTRWGRSLDIVRLGCPAVRHILGLTSWQHPNVWSFHGDMLLSKIRIHSKSHDFVKLGEKCHENRLSDDISWTSCFFWPGWKFPSCVVLALLLPILARKKNIALDLKTSNLLSTSNKFLPGFGLNFWWRVRLRLDCSVPVYPTIVWTAGRVSWMAFIRGDGSNPASK